MRPRLSIWFLVMCLLNAPLLLLAQHQEPPAGESSPRHRTDHNNREVHGMHFPLAPPDTSLENLQDFFAKGRMGGHLRNYVMATQNDDGRPDFVANAFGMALKAETANWRGFQFGVSGILTFNLASNDLYEKVALPGGGEAVESLSRFELQLFDLEEPDNRFELDRIEELFLRYHWKQSLFVLGRQDINTPLMNPQDTRMKPYVFEGVWTHIADLNKLEFNAGFFWRASSRGTIEWHSIERSIGTFSQGRALNGEPAEYRGNTSTDGVGVFGLRYEPIKNLKLKIWDYWIEDILNTAMAQLDYRRNLGAVDLISGGMYLNQVAAGNGGSDEVTERYYAPSQTTHLFGGRLGFATDRWSATANLTHVTDDGRFVFPREWGREQFYTTTRNARLDGLGDVTQYGPVLKYKPLGAEGPLSVNLHYVRTNAPDRENVALNKYGVGDRSQYNVDLRYHFSGLFQGLRLRFLYIRANSRDKPADLERLTNRAGFNHYSLVANFLF